MPLVRRSIESAAPEGLSEWVEIDEETIDRSFEFSDDEGISVDGPSYQEGMDLDNSLYKRAVEEQNGSKLSAQHAVERLNPLQSPSPYPAQAEAVQGPEEHHNATTIPPPFVFNASPGNKLQLSAKKNTPPRHKIRLISREPSAQGLPTAEEMQRYATREERLYGTVADCLAVSTRHHQIKLGLYGPRNEPAIDPFPERSRQFSEDYAHRKRLHEEMLADEEAAQRPIPMFQISLKSWFSSTVRAVLITPLFRIFSRRQCREQRAQAQVFAVPVENGKRRCVLRGDERIPTPHVLGNFEEQPATAASQTLSTAVDLASTLRERLQSLSPVRQLSRRERANRARHYRLAQAPDLSRLSERSESESPKDLTDFDASLDNCLAASPLDLAAARRTGRDGQQDTTQVATPDVEVESVAPVYTSVDTMAVSETSSEEPAPVVRSWARARQLPEESEEEKDRRIDLLTRRARRLVLRTKSEEDAVALYRAGVEQSNARRLAEKEARQAGIEAAAAERAKVKLEWELKKKRAQEEAKAKRWAQYEAEEAAEAAEENAWLKGRLDAKAREEQEAKARREADLAENIRMVKEARRMIAGQHAEPLPPIPLPAAQPGAIFADAHIIVEPTDAMIEQLDTKMHAAQGNGSIVATTVTGTPLDRIAIARVLGGASGTAAWLSDATVNAWMLCLTTAMNEKRGWKKAKTAPTPPFAAYSSAWYDQIRDKGASGLKRWTSRLGIKSIVDVEQIFFPICMGSHWTLLVVHGKTHTIEYLDSLGGNGHQPITHIRSLLEAELGAAYKASEWTVARSRSQHQTNGDDCGMFTCFNALAAVCGVAYREITAAKMPLARRLMASILVNGGFTGDAELP